MFERFYRGGGGYKGHPPSSPMLRANDALSVLLLGVDSVLSRCFAFTHFRRREALLSNSKGSVGTMVLGVRGKNAFFIS